MSFGCMVARSKPSSVITHQLDTPAGSNVQQSLFLNVWKRCKLLPNSVGCSARLKAQAALHRTAGVFVRGDATACVVRPGRPHTAACTSTQRSTSTINTDTVVGSEDFHWVRVKGEASIACRCPVAGRNRRSRCNRRSWRSWSRAGGGVEDQGLGPMGSSRYRL